MLDRLERKRLVRRRPNPEDRRGVLVALTPLGLEVIDEAMSRPAAAEHELVDGLPSASASSWRACSPSSSG